MKALVLLSCIALTYARPEAGYAYNGPSQGGFSGGAQNSAHGFSGGFGAGGGGGGGGGFGGNVGFNGGGGGGHLGGGGGHLGGGGGHLGGGGGHLGGGGGGHLGGGGGSGGHLGGGGGGGGHLGGGFGGVQSGGFGGGFSSGVGGSADSGSGGGYASGYSAYGAPAPPAIVKKHIYVHVPPPDHDEHKPRKPVQVPQAQKHYKIIFIKAPSAPAHQQSAIPLIPQHEEKTLIYVLAKKPEDESDIVIPTAPPTPPSKPEVYFIKYNTKKEHQDAGGYDYNAQPTHGDGGVGIGLDGGHGGDLSAPAPIGGVGIGQIAQPSGSYGTPGKSGPY